MKPIVWVALALWVVGCGGTNYFFENADATADAWDGAQRETDSEVARESGTVADVGAGSTDAEEGSLDASTLRDAGNLRDAGTTRDAGRDAGADASVRDATARDSGDAGILPPDAAPDVPCVPVGRPVACANAQCGPVPDGCGGTYPCGTCAAPRVCASNTCQCPATPDSVYCATHGYDCGGVVDTCSGAPRNCGRCAGSVSTCGGGGHPNVCGCTPLTACPAGDDCGSIANGCGGVVPCGTCSSPNTCGGGGVRNHCGCRPLLACPDPASCGTMPDGCGGLVTCNNLCLLGQCGPVDGGGGGSCPPNVCCQNLPLCTPTTDPSCPVSAVSCDPSVTPPNCTLSPSSDGGGGGPVVWCCP